MKLKTTLAAFAVLATVLAGLLAAPRAEAQMKRHSAAWYRTHRPRRRVVVVHRAPRRSAAWYRSHRRHR